MINIMNVRRCHTQKLMSEQNFDVHSYFFNTQLTAIHIV